jgi:shikimate dehydrogenase
LKAKECGICAEGGLYMLVAQAVRASEIFLDTKYPLNKTDEIYEKILSDKENVVLIGMPASGKTTVGKILAERLQRKFIDTDVLVEEKAGKSITEIFETEGEEAFRDMEAEVIKEVSSLTGAVIATGGGSVLRKENLFTLKKNGKIYFIDRPLESLIPTSDRPLLRTREDIEKRYNERYGIYTASADVKINANTDADTVSETILGDFLK